MKSQSGYYLTCAIVFFLIFYGLFRCDNSSKKARNENIIYAFSKELKKTDFEDYNILQLAKFIQQKEKCRPELGMYAADSDFKCKIKSDKAAFIHCSDSEGYSTTTDYGLFKKSAAPIYKD
jgi:hypothetical protein